MDGPRVGPWPSSAPRCEVQRVAGQDLDMGIVGIEEVAGGRLPAGSCILAVAPAGLLTDVLSAGFLREGIASGEGVLLVLGHETPRKYTSQMKALSVGLGAHASAGKVHFIDWHSFREENIAGVEEDDQITKCSVDLLNVQIAVSNVFEKLESSPPRRALIHVLSSALSLYDFNTVYHFAQNLLSKLENKGITSLFIIDEDQTGPESKKFHPLFESVFRLEQDPDAPARAKLTFLKMSRPGHDKGPHDIEVRENVFHLVKEGKEPATAPVPVPIPLPVDATPGGEEPVEAVGTEEEQPVEEDIPPEEAPEPGGEIGLSDEVPIEPGEDATPPRDGVPTPPSEPERPEPPKKPGEKHSDLFLCPFCAAFLPFYSKECPICGSTLEDGPIPLKPEAPHEPAAEGEESLELPAVEDEPESDGYWYKETTEEQQRRVWKALGVPDDEDVSPEKYPDGKAPPAAGAGEGTDLWYRETSEEQQKKLWAALGVRESFDTDEEGELSSGIYLCPECGAFISQNARDCSMCGAELVEGDEDEELPEPEPGEVPEDADAGALFLCPECGAFMGEDSDECPVCGVVLEMEEDEEEVVPAEELAITGEEQDDTEVFGKLMGMPKPKPKTPQKREAYICPQCHEPVPVAETQCPICGYTRERIEDLFTLETERPLADQVFSELEAMVKEGALEFSVEPMDEDDALMAELEDVLDQELEDLESSDVLKEFEQVPPPEVELVTRPDRELTTSDQKIGMTNGLGRPKGMTNGVGRTNGLTNGLGRTNGLTNGLGRTNGLTNGLGRTNGLTNGLGRTNGLTNGLGRTNGVGFISGLGAPPTPPEPWLSPLGDFQVIPIPGRFSGDPWFLRGVNLQREGHFDECLYYYNRAIEMDPGDKRAWANLAAAHRRMGNLERALECVDRAIVLDEKFLVAWNNKGNILWDAGRCDAALTCHQLALVIDTKLEMSWNNRGVDLHDLSRLAKAEHSFKKALALNVEYPLAWNNLGCLLADMGQRDEALKCFEKALDQRPSFVMALYNKAFLQFEMFDLDAAHSTAQAAVGTDPRHAASFNVKGLVELAIAQSAEGEGREKWLGEALESFQEALMLDPERAEFWVNRGTVLLLMKRYDEALSDFDGAVAKDPEHPKAYYNRACTLAVMDNKVPALNNLKTALNLAPELVPIVMESPYFEGWHEFAGFKKALKNAGGRKKRHAKGGSENEQQPKPGGEPPGSGTGPEEAATLPTDESKGEPKADGKTPDGPGIGPADDGHTLAEPAADGPALSESVEEPKSETGPEAEEVVRDEDVKGEVEKDEPAVDGPPSPAPLKKPVKKIIKTVKKKKKN